MDFKGIEHSQALCHICAISKAKHHQKWTKNVKEHQNSFDSNLLFIKKLFNF